MLKEIIDKINKTSDYQFKVITDCDGRGRSALMCAIYHNVVKTINLSEDEWSYLIRNSDLKHVERGLKMNTLLSYLFYGNGERVGERANIGVENVDYLLKNSDLKHTDSDKNNALSYLLLYNSATQTLLNREQTDYLAEQCEDQELIFYAMHWTCPIWTATKKGHNDSMIIKMIEKRLGTAPEYFNKKYFDGIFDETIRNKLAALVDETTIKKEINKGLCEAPIDSKKTPGNKI